MSQRPLIGLQPRRRRGNDRAQRLFMVTLLAVGGYLWVTEIGSDLQRADYQPGARPPMVVAGLAPGGPAPAKLPKSKLPALDELPVRGSDDVQQILLKTARDHEARRVIPTIGPVMSLNAVKGNSADLLERAFANLDFRLRTALILHRFRSPRAYGLSKRPQATELERRRALSLSNLQVFFERFAQQLPREYRVDGPDTYRAGDVVLVRTGVKGRRHFAIVGDKTSDSGVRCLFTLDPRDRHARSDRPLSDYSVIAHFRFGDRELRAVRRALPMMASRKSRSRTL